MSEMHADVVVVGAGVIGSSIAYHLARDGANVVVIDPASEPQPPAASWASAGGIRRQNRDPREAALTNLAAARWAGLANELEAEIGFRSGGHLHIVEHESDVAALYERVARERTDGIDVALVDAADIRDIAPLSVNAVAAAYTPGDGNADPRATTRAFLAAARRHGANVIVAAIDRFVTDGDAVRGVIVRDRSYVAPWTVLAAGSWSRLLAKRVGVELPVQTRSYQMLLTTRHELVLRPTITATGRALSLKQLDDGAFLIGGGWPGCVDVAAHTVRVLDASVEGSTETARSVLAAVGSTEIAQAWCGLEGDSLDGVPFIGPCHQRPGLYVAAGFTGHGFQLAPAVGRSVATALETRSIPPELASLNPARAERFDSDTFEAFVSTTRSEPGM